MITLLVDNGSLAPAATQRLRELAAALEKKIGARVLPVSLLHSSGIPVAELDGIPAQILEPALERLLGEGQREFVVVPLFFGPSRALTEFLPDRIAHLRTKHGNFALRVAPTLHQADDDRLARILADNIRSVAGHLHPLRVALVDHGTPVRELTAVREALAIRVAEMLPRGSVVQGCSMERRAGAEYDFNEPLLEKLLEQEEWNRGEVIVALQFLLPGRHAGPGGDVAKICLGAGQLHARLRTRLTPLVAEHALLLAILADRWRAAQPR